MMTLAQAAQRLQAVLLGGDEQTFLRVVTDSRHIQAGDVFVALRGENFNGHDFVDQALAKGAVGAIVDQLYQPAEVGPFIVVEDTTAALGQLAHSWRKQMPVKLLGITGSSGKTTVKEMLAAMLCQVFGHDAVLATHGNLNNQIGVPLTLLSLTPRHRFAVIEMGMSDFGEIRYLTQLAEPDVAMVNNAQGAHLEALGSVEGVAQAKAEIFAGLPENGVAVINTDASLASIWQQASAQFTQISFGLKDADIHAEAIALGVLGSHWRLAIRQDTAPVQLGVPGLHNVQNALAAAAMASTCGLGAQQIAKGLAQFAGIKGRLHQKIAYNGAVLIDDTYNANPASIRAAIDVLAQFPAPRLLILGDMGEVGRNAAEIHRLLGMYAQEKGIERFLALGDHMRFAAMAFSGLDVQGEHFTTLDALVRRAREVLQRNSTVLVKGSRFMQMERVVAALESITEQE